MTFIPKQNITDLMHCGIEEVRTDALWDYILPSFSIPQCIIYVVFYYME